MKTQYSVVKIAGRNFPYKKKCLEEIVCPRQFKISIYFYFVKSLLTNPILLLEYHCDSSAFCSTIRYYAPTGAYFFSKYLGAGFHTCPIVIYSTPSPKRTALPAEPTQHAVHRSACSAEPMLTHGNLLTPVGACG